MQSPAPEFPLDVPVPATFNDAMAFMRNRDWIVSQAFQKQAWRANREGAHPDILEFERVFLRRMTNLGIPMFASEVMRTLERQNELYALGNSKAKGGQSAHQFGCAIDLVHAVKGWSLPEKCWLLIGHIGKELITQKGLAIESFVWGGDWEFYDPAHWQVADWKTLKGEYPWPSKAKKNGLADRKTRT